MKHDLEDRTKNFSKEVINLCKTIRINHINSNIISQVLRSSTSVGANYREANAAISRKDFTNKIHICRKEIQETGYWLELLLDIDQKNKHKISNILRESIELAKIFNKISSTLKNNAPTN